MKFLLVEDDPSHAVLMTEQLKSLGADVVRADTVASAIQRLGADPGFELVVLDRDLPDGQGFEVQDFLNTKSNAPPVLFATADDTAEPAVQAMKNGAEGYVVKRPSYLAELLKEASRILCAGDATAAGNRSEYEERQRCELTQALERNQWNVSATARQLGLGRGKLRSRMDALGINA